MSAYSTPSSQWGKIVSASKKALEVGQKFLSQADLLVVGSRNDAETIDQTTSKLTEIGHGMSVQLQVSHRGSSATACYNLFGGVLLLLLWFLNRVVIGCHTHIIQ